ncbi:MAG: cation:proton antiporter [Candidatus Aenigmarchaeota archaeon]|nr:cation:proton antiporter [Candidatus Aenigmarchaeota archaeon]
MYMIFSIVFMLSIFFFMTHIFRKMKISTVIGMIISGLIIASAPFRDVYLIPNYAVIETLGDIGLLGIMFIAGLEVSWSMLYSEKKDAAIIAVLASFTPFFLGFVVFFFAGFPIETSLFVGVCMSITAEATKARVLMEMRKLKTKIGSLMMGAGIIDDIIGMSLFFIIGYFFHTSLPSKEVLLLAGVILSFFFGVFVHREIGRHENMIPEFEKIITYIFVPFFFISMGMRFSFESLILNPFLIIMTISVAIVGKMTGSLLTKPFTKLKTIQLYLVGWGMNSRGAVELALAYIALRSGLLDVGVYSSLIIMAMATTMIFPFIFTRTVKKNPTIMD